MEMLWKEKKRRLLVKHRAVRSIKHLKSDTELMFSVSLMALVRSPYIIPEYELVNGSAFFLANEYLGPNIDEWCT